MGSQDIVNTNKEIIRLYGIWKIALLFSNLSFSMPGCSLKKVLEPLRNLCLTS